MILIISMVGILAVGQGVWVGLIKKAKGEVLVDRFGQRVKGNWPGKLKNENELFKQTEKENFELEVWKIDSKLDKYGGWKEVQLKATGFFRTEKVNDIWWLVTPEGHPFFSVGMNTIHFRDTFTRIKGMENAFASPLPDEGRPGYWKEDPTLLTDHWQDDVFSFYKCNLAKKYGDNYRQRWLEVTYNRLHYWRFNTIGCYSYVKLFSETSVHPIPYVTEGIRLHEMGIPFIFNTRLPDVFHPDFESAVDKEAGEICSRWQDDPYLIGYFVGHEHNWIV